MLVGYSVPPPTSQAQRPPNPCAHHTCQADQKAVPENSSAPSKARGNTHEVIRVKVDLPVIKRGRERSRRIWQQAADLLHLNGVVGKKARAAGRQGSSSTRSPGGQGSSCRTASHGGPQCFFSWEVFRCGHPPTLGGRPSQKRFLGLCRHRDPNPASPASSEEPRGSPPFSFPPKGRKAMRCCAGPRSVRPQQASPIPGAEEPWLLPP
ncbi:uncharacterized protein LOC122446133 [Cervus canadensis]|uniref:uncharacterized protein LOC122446133 n=1 Tax=Cervus canadensis TaxID=1574408 RepID=UPI001C9E3AE6|nr:uncharacterized protein LOC122446133 [Cervus canadensis]